MKIIMQGGLDLIVNDGGVWCSEPFVYLILCPKELCIWMLEIRPVNNEHGYPHLSFRRWHTIKVVDF